MSEKQVLDSWDIIRDRAFADLPASNQQVKEDLCRGRIS